MKKIVVVLAILSSSLVWAGNQVVESTIPQIIAMNFKYQFPGANQVVWHKDNNSYEAKYVESGKTLSVFYNAKGQIVEIDRELSTHELPALYKNRLHSYFKEGYKITSLVVADDFSKNPYYLIKVMHEGVTYEFQFEDFELNDRILHQQRQNTYVW